MNPVLGGTNMDKKKYVPSRVPEREGLLTHVAPTYTTVVNQERKFVEVSDSFCTLVGYKTEELIGRRFDHLTALNTADIPTTFHLFSKLGYMHGLWLLVHRTGYRILIRYESWLRPDANIQSNIEVVQIIRHHLAAHLERRQPFL
jgi:PAS domain-containing protein